MAAQPEPAGGSNSPRRRGSWVNVGAEPGENIQRLVSRMKDPIDVSCLQACLSTMHSLVGSAYTDEHFLKCEGGECFL